MASIRFDLYHAVLDAMAAAGCAPMKPEAVVFDGRLHRYDVAGDRRGRQNGWFVLHDTIIPFGAFGSWKTGVTQGWSGGDVEALVELDDAGAGDLGHDPLGDDTVVGRGPVVARQQEAHEHVGRRIAALVADLHPPAHVAAG